MFESINVPPCIKVGRCPQANWSFMVNMCVAIRFYGTIYHHVQMEDCFAPLKQVKSGRVRLSSVIPYPNDQK